MGVVWVRLAVRAIGVVMVRRLRLHRVVVGMIVPSLLRMRVLWVRRLVRVLAWPGRHVVVVHAGGGAGGPDRRRLSLRPALPSVERK